MPIFVYTEDQSDEQFQAAINEQIAPGDSVASVDPGELNAISIDIPETSKNLLDSYMRRRGYSFVAESVQVIIGTHHWGKFATDEAPPGMTEGAITGFTNESISNKSIASVDSDGGNARFNFTVETVAVGDTVIIFGYVTNTDYNDTHVVTAVGAGTFTIDVPFGSDEAVGFFNMNVATVAATAHGHSNGDYIVIRTDTELYNAGFQVYDVTANTFRIFVVYNGTEAGLWITGLAAEGDTGFNTTIHREVCFNEMGEWEAETSSFGSPFGSFGVLQNFMSDSENMDEKLGSWFDINNKSTITLNNALAPNGEMTADTAEFTDTGLVLRRTMLGTEDSTLYTLAVWGRVVSGDPELRFDLQDGPSATIIFDDTMRRHVVELTSGAIGTFLDFNKTTAVGTFEFWGWSLTEGAGEKPYVKTGRASLPIARVGAVANFNLIAPDIDADAVTVDNVIEFGDRSTQTGAALPDETKGRVSTIGLVQSASIVAQENTPNGLFIRGDGLKIYVAGNQSDAILEYDLTTSWDISTLAFVQSFDVSTEETGPNGVCFTPDGLCVFVIGNVSDSVHQYFLSTAWDISTAVLSASFSVASEDDAPADIVFNPNGLSFYILGITSDTIYRYNLLTSFDISTASYSGDSFALGANTESFGIRPDGRFLYTVPLAGADVIEYRLTTAWDITTSQQEDSFTLPGLDTTRSLVFSPAVHRMYTCSFLQDSIFEFSLGLKTPALVTDLVLIQDLFASRVGIDTIEVHTGADIDDLATAGVITITTPTCFDIRTDGVTFTSRFVVTDGVVLKFSGTNAPAPVMIWAGTGDLFTGDMNLDFQFASIVAVGGGDLLGITSSVFSQMVDGAFIGFNSIGAIDQSTLFLRAMEFIGIGTGLDSINSRLITNSVGGTASPASGPLYNLLGNFADVQLVHSGGNSNQGTPLVRFDPGLMNGRLLVTGTVGDWSSLFDISGGATGTFTAVADAAVASTGIDSVTDSGGVARFNFTVGPTLFINQQVIVTGFITNIDYNQAAFITVVGAGFFEVVDANGVPTAFGSDEASGSFFGISVTLTDTGTSLVDGDTMVIDTDGSTDYDGGVKVYNQLVNSFQINRSFAGTATGSWDTSGVDQTDQRVVAQSNLGFLNSNYIASAFVNNNTTAVGAIVNNTFTDMVFGTPGAALIAASTMEGFKLVDEVNGTFEYTDLEPFDGELGFDFTVVSSGGTVDFRFKWLLSTGGPFADLADPVEALAAVGSDAQSITKTYPLRLTLGHQIKPVITRNSGTSGITASYATIFAQGQA